MILKSYPSYKDSGHDWIGRAPAHWAIEKFRYCFKESPEKIEDEIVGQMLSVSGYRGIEIKEYEDENRKRLDQDLIGYRIVRPGQLVVNTMWLNYAGLGVSEHEGHVSPAYRSYWINDDLNKRFIHHLMRSGVYVIGYTKFLTGIRPNSLQMSRDDLMVFPVLVPLLSEQEGIATFLDSETAKLDTLIAKQEKLIELLQENRQAIISHAVTKGLNPVAKMKDSGVEWLGEVPEHWEVLNLRYLGFCQNGINIGAEYFGSGYPFVSYGDVYKNEVLPEDGSGLVQSSENDRNIYSVLNGDIFFTKTSETIDEIGLTSVCINSIRNATFAGFLIRFRPKSNLLDANFSKYYFRNILLRAFFVKEMNLVTRASLSQDLLKKLPVTLPPFEEQKKIAEYLDKKTKKIDQLIKNVGLSIELMKERRTVLISAAVTGRIDVREYTN